MKFGKKLLAAFFLLAQFASAPANAYVLLPEPPATGFVMNLDLPTTQFQTLGYGLTSWSKLAEGALASWNGAGIGSGPDFNFFKITNPVVAGDACDRDGVNEVRFAADNCGFSYGDALAVTFRWIVNGVRVEEDVIFDTNPPGGWNAYAGLLRRASNGSDTLNDFVRVAIHEFGHAAGLNHPDQAGQSVAAIMNSRVSNVDALQTDDINGAHAIKWSLVSGAGATSSTTTSTTSTTKTTTTASTTTSVGPTTTTTLSGSGQISMQNYFPFQAGNEWIYQDEIGGVVTTYKRTVGQTPVSIKGVATIAWADSDGVTRYMTNDANGIRRFANSSQEFVAGFGNVSFNSTYTPPELYAPALVQLGSSVTQTGSITLTASDGSSRTDTFSQTIGFSSDSVSVPAGTFAAVRLTIVRTVSGATSTNTIWAADGVGIVKFKFDDGTGAVETVSLASINFTSAPGAAKLNLIPGFNLVGNGAAAAVNVAAAFGDANKVATVWKWLAGSAKWAFYAPSLAGQALTDFTAGKGYEVLTTINGGEGFWVNARTAFSAQLPAGAPVSSTVFQSLASGFNLVASGDNKTPSQFNVALGTTPPSTGVIPLNVTSLWAWDAAQSNWYFYASSLEKSGGLAAFVASKGYLDFGARTLDATTGFWVNKP